MLFPTLHEIYYLLLFNHYKVMSDYLYIPSNLKGLKDHIQDYIVKLQNLFTIKSISVQRKCEV